MKRNLLLILALIIGATSFAQGNGKAKGKYKNKQNKEYKYNDRRDRDDDDYDRRVNRDRDYEYNRNRNVDGKYSKNVPAKVRQAFNRDFSNTKNVTWTKDRGIWTAHFDRAGLFGGNNRYASYYANGRRVGANDSRTARNDDGSIFRKKDDDRNRDRDRRSGSIFQ